MKPQSKLYIGIVNDIREDHIHAAKQEIRSEEIIATLESEIEAECGRLESFLSAAQVCLYRNKWNQMYCEVGSRGFR